LVAIGVTVSKVSAGAAIHYHSRREVGMLSNGTSQHGVNDAKRANDDALHGFALRLRASARRTSGVRGFARRSAFALIAVFALAGLALPAHADVSGRPMTLVVGSSPGGGADRTARLLAAKLAEYLHQPFVVENRAGAGTRLASDYVGKSAPDGHTLLFVTGEATLDLALDPRASPNVLKDLMPVSQIATCQMLLVVNASLPVHSVQELLAYARTTPGKLNYSTAGVKTTMHLAGELFKLRTGTDIVHIPYKGSNSALSALVANDVDMTYASLPSALPFVESGRLRALAVAGNARSPLMPGIPTMAEAGVAGIEATIWYGLLAPAGTPPDVVDALARAVEHVSGARDYRQDLAVMGEEPSPSEPAAFGEMLRSEVARFRGIIRVAGIRAE
jgi:tripartite-type tricarboxylate transporter receptor subunit TctC